ncbi:hypothetical protein EYF80_014867 [Liparis tanakae]|uniref:Uncharacterized protein n=1 Tax=Liparis tanakae TaxID=230148 RepID=A0A4Z2IA47_9TELE|nr:hypothetical protein EYF80_014867 [Liparis tanakae]
MARMTRMFSTRLMSPSARKSSCGMRICTQPNEFRSPAVELVSLSSIKSTVSASGCTCSESTTKNQLMSIGDEDSLKSSATKRYSLIHIFLLTEMEMTKLTVIYSLLVYQATLSASIPSVLLFKRTGSYQIKYGNGVPLRGNNYDYYNNYYYFSIRISRPTTGSQLHSGAIKRPQKKNKGPPCSLLDTSGMYTTPIGFGFTGGFTGEDRSHQSPKCKGQNQNVRGLKYPRSGFHGID